jgi:isopenicillin N synthase-like dioxygenase
MTPPAVPWVDVGGTEGSHLGPAVASELTRALMESSCAFVSGHGVPDAVLAELVTVSRAFFDLSLEEKARVRWPGVGYWKGWQPLSEAEVAIDGRGPELLERFEVQMTAGTGSSDEDLWERSAGFALWPEAPAGFRLAWARYYASLARFSGLVMTAIASTLDLPASGLSAWCEEQHGNLVVNNYLAQDLPPEPGEIRQRAHTDIGGLTVLWADEAPGGLEVRMPGTPGWTAVSFPRGALLIQAGDLLARWTNNVVRANIHRVVNPPAEVATTSRRTSVVYFHYPRLDTLVVPALSCVSPDRPALAPIEAGSHLLAAVNEPQSRYRAMEDSFAG